VEVHPFRAAWLARDVDAWGEALAADVVLYSPVISSPFRGQEAVIEVYSVLFAALGPVDITDEFAAGDAHAFFWLADIGGRRVEGADLFRTDADGKISEARVLIRPLVDIATFAAAVGPPLAAKRSRARAVVLRMLTLPLRAILLVADRLAARLSQR
jgi:hypothetical protein